MAKPKRRPLPLHIRLVLLSLGAALLLAVGLAVLVGRQAPAVLRGPVLLVWAAFVAVVVAAVALATGAWVTSPLRRLTASAERLAQGALTRPAGLHRDDEIEHLAATLDAMAEELRRKWEENSELYRRELRRVHMLQALEEVAHAVNSTLSLDQVLDTITRHSLQLIGIFRCAIGLVDDDGNVRMRCATGFSPELLALLEDPACPAPCLHQAIAEGRVVAAYEPTGSEALQAAWRQEGVAAMACAPMVTAGRSIGAITICSSEQGAFTDEQLQVLAALAAQAATAVQNARLYEESQRKTRELRSSFRRIGAALASGTNLDDTLSLIAELACEMLHADACLIRLRDRATGELTVRATHGLMAGEVERMSLRSGQGLSGRVALAGRPVAVADLTEDPAALGFSATTAIRAYLGVPLRVKSEVFGVLAIFRRCRYEFNPEEVELLSSFAAQAAIALENRRLWEQEREQARTLQRSFLPVIPRTLEGLELGELYAPSQQEVELGGDFYDLFPVEHGRFGVVIGDVCGKGLTAAVYTAMAKYALRHYAFDDPSPAEVMRKTNRSLCRQITEEGLFISIIYALIDSRKLTLALANAGHPPPIHYRRATGTAVLLPCEGTVAGLLPQPRYQETHVALAPGDILLFYTDGIVEARRGREIWGGEALAQSVARHANQPMHALVQAVLEDATAYATRGIHDDIALLAIRLRP
ncbi:MAG: SpoIIE family protein phosphatase [Armatimonadetes bacterium]|nr:SpoIIE family protein phosphatase [Armatimonadota bacterium]